MAGGDETAIEEVEAEAEAGVDAAFGDGIKGGLEVDGVEEEVTASSLDETISTALMLLLVGGRPRDAEVGREDADDGRECEAEDGRDAD